MTTPTNDPKLREILTRQLDNTLSSTDLSLGDKYEGKVRDCYVHDDTRVIVVTDRLSAFDRVVGTIPFKGQVLNQMAQYWFQLTEHIAPNHVISVPDPNVMVVHECTPLRAEFVMRSYLTGVTSTSIWRQYSQGVREYCGHRLPDGMRKNEPLARPLLTPSTKAPKGDHDVSVSRDQLIEMGHIEPSHFERGAEIAEALFAFGQRKAAERGLILVDTKYEMGISPSGEIVVIDEIHTPDSSRYWYADDYEERLKRGEEPRSLDKEYVRRWFAETHDYRGDGEAPQMTDEVRVEAAARYIANYELITAQSFEPDTVAPAQRIERNLQGIHARASEAG